MRENRQTQTERAMQAGGCFWGMQDLIRKKPGVTSTRVGYSGGDVAYATYRNHGTPAEAIEIIFDPAAGMADRFRQSPAHPGEGRDPDSHL